MNDILQYKNYFATLNYSSEDEVFYGKVIGINDLIIFEGNSVKELQKAFAQSIEDYLETCTALKKQPEKTYKGSFNVRIPADLHREAALHAAKMNISLNDFIRMAIDFSLANKDLDMSFTSEKRKEY
jgi:predicted HicB family RNase H-like nuclease